MKKILFILMLLSQTAYATNYCNDSSIVECYTAQENSGTSLVDHSSNSNSGTFASSGHPAWTAAAPTRSYLTYSLAYSTSSDFITLPSGDITSFKASSQAMTFVGWLYPTSAGSSAPRVISRSSTSEGSLNLNATNDISFGSPGVSLVNRITSNNTLTLNTWQHIAVTWDGSATAANIHIYINGVEQSYQTSTDGSSLSDQSGGTFYLGNRADGTRNLNGKITEIAIFKRALSGSEITDIYTNGLLQVPTSHYDTIRGGSIIRGIIN